MPSILVVDDHPSNREVLTTLLGYGGHTVFEAQDGDEGLSIAAREQPDLIISDVLMPTMDGYEFVRRLRRDPNLARKPVVFYTAFYLEHEALALANKCGVAHVLRKPCEPQEVLDVVKIALGCGGPPADLPEDVAHQHLELITNRLSRTAEELERTNLRLEALIEAGQKLASEHDPWRLVDEYAKTARELVGVNWCVIGIADVATGNWSGAASSGLTKEAAGAILADWKPGRAAMDGNPFPEGHLPVPIRTPEHFFGWLCVAGKIGGGQFTEDDEKLVRTLAAQLAVAYENAELYKNVRQHAAELEERVRERTRDLEAAHRELESFTLAVSHDLRIPLHHLNGFSSLLEERFGGDMEPDASDLVRRIQRTSHEMTDLVQSLMDLARISRQELQFETVSLDGIVREAIEETNPGDGRAIEWRIGRLGDVEGSRALLKQVFVNLLSNAVKFTARIEHATIEIGELSRDGELLFYVRDNGVGFDPKQSDRLFVIFNRLHRQNEYPGTGAGLAIVERILMRHGGRIWAESTPGQGAVFYFTLPGRLCTTEPGCRECGAPPAQAGSQPGSRCGRLTIR